MSTGIKFHTEGAAERKALETIAVLIRETVRAPDSDDLKRCSETWHDQSTLVCRLEQQF